ncbi:DUF4352 domain-containing protein [Demequina pelophila]|uniref:DUF4352 domain-containing protein n=1 Tax=Demequina pelophila TaxID=1638984 RepID=UPI0007857B29|nr:DUF4352 domain-containing protein [Demequina pelophila]
MTEIRTLAVSGRELADACRELDVELPGARLRRKVSMRSIGAAAALGLAGLSGGPGLGQDEDATALEASLDDATPDGDAAALVPGQSVTDGEIAVTVGEATWSADRIVASENMFNEPAPSGASYVMVPVTVANVAVDDAVAPRAAVTLNYVAPDGSTYAPARQVVPEDLDEAAAIAAGETVTGNVLFAIPTEAQGGGSWRVGLGDQPAPVTYVAA